jgi:menaquinone-dependent protoporphyrinogen oxidase
MTVHVVVASKHGSTREVGEAIADELGAEFRDASAVDGFDGADAVVLGSAIYGGRWLEPARKLVDERAEELVRLPTWLFSVGPIGDPPKPEDAGPDKIDQVVASTRAHGHEVFAWQAQLRGARPAGAHDGQGAPGARGRLPGLGRDPQLGQVDRLRARRHVINFATVDVPAL